MDNLLTHNEFLDVVEIVKECAHTAFNESRLEMRRTVKERKPLPDSAVDKYMAAYANSTYANSVSVLYKEYVRQELREIVQVSLGKQFSSNIRAEIMVPVLIYSLIIRNEGKPEKVQTRARKVDKAGSLDSVEHWRVQNPYGSPNDKYRPTEDSNILSEKIQELNREIKKSSFCNSTYMSQSSIEVIKQIHQLEGNIHNLKAMEAMSRAGLFLNDLLTAGHSNDCQLNTILRLYCVTMIHEVIQASRIITDDSATMIVNGQIRFKEYASLDIVTEYAYDQLGYDLAYNFDLLDTKFLFPISLKQGIDSGIIKKFKNTPIKKGKKFDIYYKFLIENFDFSFPNIINFYLDTEKLETYIHATDHTKRYLTLQKQLVYCLPADKSREPDLNVVRSSIHLIKTRKDIIAKQRFISMYASEDEEKTALQNQQRENAQNFIAVHPRLYDTLEWACFSYDDYADKEFADIDRDELPEETEEDLWKVLADELFDMFYELSYQKRDYAYDSKQREYLMKRIQEKISTAKDMFNNADE